MKNVQQLPIGSLQQLIEAIIFNVDCRVNQFEFDVQPPPTTQYLTQQEVAWKLNVSIRTVRTYSRIGLLKAYRFGHRVFYKRHELITVSNSMQF